MIDPEVGEIWLNRQGGGALVDKVVRGQPTVIWFVRIGRNGKLKHDSGIYGFNAFFDAFPTRGGFVNAEQIATWEKEMEQPWPGRRPESSGG